MVLEELSLPYTVNKLEFNEVKQESYVALNPNGRLPTMHDPNTGITVWEVGPPFHPVAIAFQEEE